MKVNLLSKIADSKIVNNHLNRVIKDDAFAAKTLVAINVAKDVFAYGVRFKTTMDNKEIPEEKKPFIASMDLMSGVITAAMQIGVGFSLASPKVQNKIWNKFFRNCKFEDIGAAKKGFSQILALIGSTILAERLLVPLIATPAAQKFEKKFFKGKETPKITENNYMSLDEFKQSLKNIEQKAMPSKLQQNNKLQYTC